MKGSNNFVLRRPQIGPENYSLKIAKNIESSNLALIRRILLKNIKKKRNSLTFLY